MHMYLIGSAVGFVLFVFGSVFTILHFAKRDRAVLSVIVLLAPALTVISFIRVPYLVFNGRLKMDPCPTGLEEAEVDVAEHRHRMFGGEFRQPTFATSWKKAYERELQRELAQVQDFAERYLIPA